jgi:hypothetical protein
MFELNYPKMMAADEGVDGSTSNINQDLSELNDESTQLDEPEEEEEIPIDEEEPSEEEEDQESEDERSESEEAANVHPFDRPSLRTINEAFPELFKKFPAMRDMYFREAEYSKLFPTVEDAKEANENNAAFTSIKDDIFNGDGSKFMSAINSVDPRGLEKFATGFLPSLTKTNMNAFWKAANPLIEDVSRAMFNKGKMSGDENLANAGLHLSQFFFGKTEFAEGKASSRVMEDQGETEVAKEKREWEDRKHLEFRSSLETDLRSQLDEIVIGEDPRTGKSKLDPDDLLSPFIKQTIVDHVVQDIGAALAGDTAHMRYMDSLWSRAKSNGRRQTDKEKIINAYLNRARSMAPALRSKYVSEALGRRARAAGEKVRRVESIPARTPSNGRTHSSDRSDYSPKKIDYRKTSDYDILNDDVKYKD